MSRKKNQEPKSQLSPKLRRTSKHQKDKPKTRRVIYLLVIIGLFVSGYLFWTLIPKMTRPVYDDGYVLPSVSPSPLFNDRGSLTSSLPTRQEIIAEGQELLEQEVKIEAEKLELVLAEEVEWRDSCLGVDKPGQYCLEVITPGYRLIYRDSEGAEYEVHTDLSGRNKVIVDRNF